MSWESLLGWVGVVWLSHTHVMGVTVTLMDPAETQGRGTVRAQSPNTGGNINVENTGWKRNVAAIEKHTLEIQSFNSYGLLFAFWIQGMVLLRKDFRL